MIGSIRWNVVLGVMGFGLTFLLSTGNNFLTTTLLHSLYSFLIMFGIGFVVRWGLGTLAGFKDLQESVHEANLTESQGGKGTNVDSITPDEQDELNQMLRDNLNGAEPNANDFTLLKPKKLSTLPAEPEELAQAIRRMSEE